MSDIITELSEGVLRIEMNRPSKKNAMTGAMYTGVADILNDALNDDRVRVVLWHGAGDSFTAGNDIAEFLNSPPSAGDSPQFRLMTALLAFDKPLVAAVRGASIGGGTTMLLHCDLVYAGERTRFQTPFINLALQPEFGSSFLLPLRIGHARATELLFLAAPFDAKRAVELGLVTRIVADEEVLQVATDAARALAAKPPEALRATKRLLKRAFRDEAKAAMQAENQVFSASLRSDETKEALSAFLEKRSPDFAKIKQAAAAG